jgi:hypothetical protein
MADDPGTAPVEPRRRGMDRVRATSFRISNRLNRITKVYLGPAQVDEGGRANTVQPLTSSPCPACGRPMAEHELERTPGAKARFYCPED